MELDDVEALFVLPTSGVEDEEINGVVRVFETYGISITYATLSGEEVHAREGLFLVPDAALPDVDITSFDILVVSGCSGSEGELTDPALREAVVTAREEDLVIGSVCMATRVLAGFGLLEEKQVAVPSGLQLGIVDEVGEVVEGKVARSGRMFTGSSGEVAEEVAQEIVEFVIHGREHGTL
ncbi:MAG: DJ-1/PfpI family protein [Candidatus Nanohaloarchaea archaeon]|nr:DJ-1/PfpI family protein [Candidatus Nanohaloarchaea archaeon]